MLYLLLIITPLILVLNHFQTKKSKDSEVQVTTAGIIKATGIGFVLGSYDGFFGPGTGTFFIIALVWFLNFNLKSASANARLLNYASNFSAFISFLILGKIIWSVAALGIVASLVGNYFGSQMMMKNADKIIKPIFTFVLVLLMCKCAYELI